MAEIAPNSSSAVAGKQPRLSVLAIHAHPADIEFQCAGTLALLAEAGHTIAIASMTPGDCGSRDLSAEEIARVRRGEGQRAAALIGASYECLEFRDLSIVIDNDAKQRVTEAIRRHRPDVVFTAPPVDYMDDHEATSRLVRDACFNASCPNYATRQWDPAPATDTIPHLYYVDPIEGVDYCLESQHRWSAARGSEIGVPLAEAFRQHRGHPYPGDNLLEQLLGSLVKVRG